MRRTPEHKSRRPPATTGGLRTSTCFASARSQADRGICEIGFLVVLNPAGVHEARSQEGKRCGEHQLRVQTHELRDPDCRLFGLLKMLKDWVEHPVPPFHHPILVGDFTFHTTEVRKECQHFRNILASGASVGRGLIQPLGSTRS